MLLPLRALREWCADWIPPALALPEALDRALAPVELLPDCCSQAALELRVGREDPRVDFAACVTAGEGREALAARPRWSSIARLCEAWSRPGAPMREGVPFLWMEFDGDPRPGAGLPEPFTYLCVQPRFLGPPLPDRAVGDEVPWRLAREGLTAELGRPLAPAIEAAARACFEALPPGGHVLHVAPLATRGSDDVRLAFLVPRTDMLAYLERIGWPGDRAQVAALLDELRGTAFKLDFALDVGERVRPLLGLQFDWRGPPWHWARLLDAFVARGFCLPEKRDALLRWPGTVYRPLPGHRWPSAIDRVLELKLVCRPGEPIEGKAYLYLSARFSLFPQ